MKYFDTVKMREIRDELEKGDFEVAGSLEQGDDGMSLLSPRQNMVAFLVTDAIVISKLSEQEEADLSNLSKRVSFKMGSKPIRKSVWELKTRENLWTILPFLKQSYKATSKAKQPPIPSRCSLELKKPGTI
ncbi:MAG TPA: hypothetical protein VNA15_11655 [Candidatus Angelobacter sp.]|nr:hypothetical protein [Candidatus Angelobacter sp.]